MDEHGKLAQIDKFEGHKVLLSHCILIVFLTVATAEEDRSYSIAYPKFHAVDHEGSFSCIGPAKNFNQFSLLKVMRDSRIDVANL